MIECTFDAIREIYGEHGKRRYTQFFALYITYGDA